MNSEHGKKTAIVFGATGLIGTFIVKELLENSAYAKVKTFVRNPSGLSHPKLEENVIDFRHLDEVKHLMTADEVYSCYGTNITQKPDKKIWHYVDVDLPILTATECRANGVKACAVVSSIGANAHGGSSYLKLKGEMEDRMQALGFAQLAIVRPSFLLGKRNKIRWHEEPARWIMQFFGLFMFGKAKGFKAIHARTVARAMITILNSPPSGKIIYNSGELRKLGV